MISCSDLEGKVAVVTGGAGILSGALIDGLVANGVKIGLLGRRLDALSEVADRVRENGGESICLVADVLDRSALEDARAEVLSKWGKIDILINAAGGNMAGATIMPDGSFFDIDLKALQGVIDLNFMGSVVPSVVFGESMSKKGQGNIIHISSMSASRPMTRVVGYSAAKAGIDNLTKWMAVEFANKYGEGMRVNAIAPGFFLTKQNERLLTEEDGSLTSRGKTIVDHTPMGRFGQPDELIGTLLWLCSDASKFVTGTTIPVDGGFSAFSGV
ncbi:SDR family oxidoreductase [Marinoscillum sp. MHG1-6]|uniref:SDR family oxidoreductase n=1 Tax=Marinoscillum sp. MHG1-6 TaxID=2959627 RepID=UPI0021584E0D|nr:SDR family oxidoreductase [Marinoscillum sp. MHG1-6]